MNTRKSLSGLIVLSSIISVQYDTMILVSHHITLYVLKKGVCKMKLFYISLGFITLLLGIIGIILPVLPTTPFLLLTAFFFGKGSVRFEERYRNSKLYQKYLSEFIENRRMTKKRKWTLLIFVDIIIIISIILTDIILLKVFLIFIDIFKHYYFYKFVEVTD